MLYKFTIAVGSRTLLVEGVTVAFVNAASEAAALVLVKAATNQDVNAVWDNASVQVLSSGVATDLTGMTFNVTVDAPALDVTYVAVAGDDFTDVGTALAALLVTAGVHATWLANSTHPTLYGLLTIATGNANAAVTAQEIVAAGTGYTDADVLTIVGGTSATAATITATTTAAGLVTVATVTNAGDYSVLPANPVSVTGGTGNDATFNLTWDAEQPGAGNVTVGTLDVNGVDVTAESMANVVDAGAATASLTVDIKATSPGNSEDGVLGLY